LVMPAEQSCAVVLGLQILIIIGIFRMLRRIVAFTCASFGYRPGSCALITLRSRSSARQDHNYIAAGNVS
jgi:hypothetical protein